MAGRNKAVVLLSGGLDSATALALASDRGFDCYALSIDYGQRHAAELQAARRIAQQAGVIEHKIVHVDLSSLGGSALTDPNIAVPEEQTTGIPPTYVPARNTVLLGIALGYAEVVGAGAIYVGVNAVDYSGYPDCRPEFISAFEQLAQVATRCGIEGQAIAIAAPLIELSKAEIITLGHSLGVDYAATVSCYQADTEGLACGRCDSCRLRKAGFRSAGLADPTRYNPQPAST